MLVDEVEPKLPNAEAARASTFEGSAMALSRLLTALVLGIFVPGAAQTPVMAEEAAGDDPVLTPGYQQCVRGRIAARQPVGSCIGTAHEGCLEMPQTSAAGTGCFLKARTEWGNAISVHMDKVRASQNEDVAAATGIELKFDIRKALLECERRDELGRLLNLPSATLAYARSNCEAIGIAIAYTQLLARTNRLGLD